MSLVAIFSSLALLRFHRATGRPSSLAGTVPTESGRPLPSPGSLACIAVGSALLLAALFGVRAIGDFR